MSESQQGSEQGEIAARKVRVLVLPCGSESALEIYQALRYSIHVELFGASSIDDHGRSEAILLCGDDAPAQFEARATEARQSGDDRQSRIWELVALSAATCLTPHVIKAAGANP